MVLPLVPDVAQRVSGAPQSRDRYRNGSWRSRVCSAPRRRAALRPGKVILELHARRLLELRALVADVEEGAVSKTEYAGKQRRRELLDAGVIFLHRVVIEAARGGELVLDVGQVR